MSAAKIEPGDVDPRGDIPRLVDPNGLTTGDVAAILKVHPDTVRRWSAAGNLPSSLTPGGRRRFRRSDVDAVLVPYERSKAAR